MTIKTPLSHKANYNNQAGTELGQAQLKLGFDFTLNFFRFGFSSSVFLEFICRFGLVNLVQEIWFSPQDTNLVL